MDCGPSRSSRALALRRGFRPRRGNSRCFRTILVVQRAGLLVVRFHLILNQEPTLATSSLVVPCGVASARLSPSLFQMFDSSGASPSVRNPQGLSVQSVRESGSLIDIPEVDIVLAFATEKLCHT